MTEGRPLYLKPAAILLVFIGGVFGTAARYGVSVLIPTVAGLPWPTLTVNLLGAFVLGFLLEALVRRGDDEGRRRMLRLLIGTGFLGGFTTYSSLAVETAGLVQADRALEAAGYALGTLVIGALATAAGIWAASARHRAAKARGASAAARENAR